MKYVLLVCASLLSLSLASPAFAAPKVDVNDNPGSTGPQFNADSTETTTTAAVCPCGVAGSASSLVAVNKGQTSEAIRPTGAAKTTTPAATSGNAEKPAGK